MSKVEYIDLLVTDSFYIIPPGTVMRQGYREGHEPWGSDGLSDVINDGILGRRSVIYPVDHSPYVDILTAKGKREDGDYIISGFLAGLSVRLVGPNGVCYSHVITGDKPLPKEELNGIIATLDPTTTVKGVFEARALSDPLAKLIREAVVTEMFAPDEDNFDSLTFHLLDLARTYASKTGPNKEIVYPRVLLSLDQIWVETKLAT